MEAYMGRLALLGLIVVTAGLAACTPKEQATSTPPPPPPSTAVAAASSSTTTTTTTMPAPPPVWRSATWGMKKTELLAAFPGEAQHLPKPADFGPPRPGASDIAIPAYAADGSTFRVLFGFGSGGLGRIQLTALKPSAAACEDLEKRLTDELSKPSSRSDSETSLRGLEVAWTTPTETITLVCVEKASLGFRTVTLDYAATDPHLR
jgi:hypothetical protein